MANAFAAGGEGGAGRSVGDDDEEFAALKTPGGEVRPERAGGIVADRRGPEGADAATFPRQRAQGEATAVLSVVTTSFSFMRMAKEILFSLRKFIHSTPTNSRSASRSRMLAAPKIARQRCINRTRAAVSLPPPSSSGTLHISGARARRVTAASIRMLTSRVPSFHRVRSSARCHGPTSPGSPITCGAGQSGPRRTCWKNRCNRRQVEATCAVAGRSQAR